MKTNKCAICNLEFIGYGNNPQPIKQEGVCCDICNLQVIDTRIKQNIIERIIKMVDSFNGNVFNTKEEYVDREYDNEDNLILEEELDEKEFSIWMEYIEKEGGK